MILRNYIIKHGSSIIGMSSHTDSENQGQGQDANTETKVSISIR
jgi:hypothetical protein